MTDYLHPTKDFLVTLLMSQRQLQKDLGEPMWLHASNIGKPTEPDRTIKENVLALIVEATEILGEINWKPWKQALGERREIDRTKLLYEIIDAFQFLANIVNEADFTAQQIIDGYDQKLKVNYIRLEDAKELKKRLGMAQAMGQTKYTAEDKP